MYKREVFEELEANARNVRIVREAHLQACHDSADLKNGSTSMNYRWTNGGESCSLNMGSEPRHRDQY